ncbi:hypothetical protein J5N97_022689 [Dioscorea zingiberensis]|uniref:PARP1-like PADR1 domain-containing protein n=1 Tax=Dioscorea zingiberensis TaxID=325984 RepID=A0A9D5HB24_9LILI|nr:hypothetical protein J5N97_022689 [Dioscorea zingiberensis]
MNPLPAAFVALSPRPHAAAMNPLQGLAVAWWFPRTKISGFFPNHAPLRLPAKFSPEVVADHKILPAVFSSGSPTPWFSFGFQPPSSEVPRGFSVLNDKLELINLDLIGTGEDKPLQGVTSMGTKHKNTENSELNSKVSKYDVDTSTIGTSSMNHNSKVSNQDTKLEEQTKALWNMKDELKKHVMTSELQEMLKENGQYSSGS